MSTGDESEPRCLWEPRVTADGSPTLENTALAQTCHSMDGAWSESVERYARACRIAETARREGVVRILDIGTGLALNIAAALAELDDELGVGNATLSVATFELDSRVLEEAALLASSAAPEAETGAQRPSFRASWRVALETISRAREGDGQPVGWSDGRSGELRLMLGDARVTLPRLDPDLAFDAIFLDPFSPASDPPLWEPGFLMHVAHRVASRGVLSTYTASLAVRAALFAAGLEVGKGPRFGQKGEGTLAGRDIELEGFEERRQRKIARRAAKLV